MRRFWRWLDTGLPDLILLGILRLTIRLARRVRPPRSGARRMSNAELLLATQLDQAGIPFVREFRFAPPRRWRADFSLYGAGPILVEIDGGGYVAGRHSRGAGMEKDAEKQSAAAILGYRVIRCTPSQVEDGRALAWIQEAHRQHETQRSGDPRAAECWY